MYCGYCGNKIDKDSKFCPFCGREVLEEKREVNINQQPKPVHNSVIRKSIKKNAMGKNRGVLYAANIIFFIAIIMVLTLAAVTIGANTGGYEYLLDFNTTSFLENTVISIIIMIISTYFVLGISKVSLNISRDKETGIGDVLTFAFQKPKTYLKVLGVNILVYLIAEALMYIPIIGAIVYCVLFIYFTPALAMLAYVMIDNEDITIPNAIKRTLEIIKGKRVAYYALALSFAGWYILSVFTFCLLLIWVIPYVTISMSNFYLSITKEKEYNDASRGLSNGAIIGITIGAYIVFIIISVIIIFSLAIVSGIKDGIMENEQVIPQDDYYDYYDDYYNNDISGEPVNILGLEVFIPTEYGEITLADYEKAYMSKEGNIIIGLLTYDMDSNVSANEYATLYKAALSDSYACGSINTKPINNYTWQVLDCSGTSANIKNYIAMQNNKVYLLTVSYTNDALTEVEKVMTNIEKELAFANAVA